MGARRTDAHGVASASEKTDFSDSTIRARDTTPCSPEILRGQPNTPESTKQGGEALPVLYAFRGTTVLYHSKREDVGGSHQEEHQGEDIRSFCSRYYTRAKASPDVMEEHLPPSPGSVSEYGSIAKNAFSGLSRAFCPPRR